MGRAVPMEWIFPPSHCSLHALLIRILIGIRGSSRAAVVAILWGLQKKGGNNGKHLPCTIRNAFYLQLLLRIPSMVMAYFQCDPIYE